MLVIKTCISAIGRRDYGRVDCLCSLTLQRRVAVKGNQLLTHIALRAINEVLRGISLDIELR